jgi:hypothetical protein
MEITERELHYRWIDTPSELMAGDEVPDPAPTPHPQPTDPPPTAVLEIQGEGGQQAVVDE